MRPESRGALREVIARGVPFLGICVGMQWLLTGSKEAPEQPGLGYFQGWCERFPEGSEKVPHVGWDHILTRTSSPTRLFAGVEQNEFVYYTHSYYVPTTIYRGAPFARESDGGRHTSTSRRSPRPWSTRT